MRKSLILFASNTGNTRKVAEELKRGFDRHGWEGVLKEIPEDYDVKNPDFDFDDYDFLSVGSPVISEGCSRAEPLFLDQCGNRKS